MGITFTTTPSEELDIKADIPVVTLNTGHRIRNPVEGLLEGIDVQWDLIKQLCKPTYMNQIELETSF